MRLQSCSPPNVHARSGCSPIYLIRHAPDLHRGGYEENARSVGFSSQSTRMHFDIECITSIPYRPSCGGTTSMTLFLTSVCCRPRWIYARGWRAAFAFDDGRQCLAIGALRFTPVVLTSPHLYKSYSINHIKLSTQC